MLNQLPIETDHKMHSIITFQVSEFGVNVPLESSL
jgi:hypothetical protein